jgi:hypothetical protein
MLAKGAGAARNLYGFDDENPIDVDSGAGLI